MKKHLGIEPTRTAESVPRSLGQPKHPWIHWGDPKEPVSEYQLIYDKGAKFSEKEMQKIQKNALFRNMSIIQSAMSKTSTTFTPAAKNTIKDKARLYASRLAKPHANKK